MKRIQLKLRVLALAAGSLAISTGGAFAATDDAYTTNDLLLFFQNPTGSVGNDQVVTFSLGSTWDVFRDAATPGDGTYGSTISLGNINGILTSTYGANWTSFSSSIFAGAAGQNASTVNVAGTANQDFNRTVYVTKPRAGAGSLGTANSSSVTLPNLGSSQGSLANNISGSNANANNQPQPGAHFVNDTVIDDYNPFFNGNPSTAYGQLNGGVMGALSSTTYALGSVSNIVLGLDLYRATPVIDASGWQTIEGISGVTAKNGYYLGTVTLSNDGAVNFAAVPEPSTYALLALAGVVVFFAIRRRKIQA